MKWMTRSARMSRCRRFRDKRPAFLLWERRGRWRRGVAAGEAEAVKRTTAGVWRITDIP